MTADAVDDGGRRKLCRTQALDHIAAHRLTGLLEPTEHLIGEGEATEDILRHHTAAGDNTVPIQPRLAMGDGPVGGVGLRRGVSDHRPCISGGVVG